MSYLKRPIAFFLTFIMLFTLVPTSALAEAGTEPTPPADLQTEPILPGEPAVPGDNTMPQESTVSSEPQLALAAAGEEDYGVAPAAVTDEEGYPQNLNDEFYLSIYTDYEDSGFPGEPAVYSLFSPYTSFNSSFQKHGFSLFGNTTYASSSVDILDESILTAMVPGTGSSTEKVWGVFSTDGVERYLKGGSSNPILDPANEAKMIKAVLGNNTDTSKYRIVWYILKYQTGTKWHLDGVIVEKDDVTINYYGNGNTGGNAPNGPSGLKKGNTYTILGPGSLKNERSGHEYNFIGWNTAENGSGTPYSPGQTITVNADMSLYAQWEMPPRDITVTKVWDDNNDQDGMRPAEVRVHLLRNDKHMGEAYKVILNEANKWTYTWEDVPTLDQFGYEIEYYVEEEEDFPGYTYTVSGNMDDGFILTNSHTPERISFEVQKVWDDGNDRDHKRPESIQVQLCKQVGEGAKTALGETVTLDLSNNWANAWHDLYKYEGGQEITYTAEEVSVPAGYTVSYGTDEHTGRSLITNSYTPETIDILVTKEWDDDYNQDGIRPDEIQLAIYANGVNTGDTITLKKEDAWQATAKGLYKNQNGAPITYSFVEKDVPAGYTLVQNATAENGYKVINKHVPENAVLRITKVWDDANDQDGIRPKNDPNCINPKAEIAVHIKADGAAVDTITITEEELWTKTITHLPKYKNGQPIVYTVFENAPKGYTATITGDAATGFTIKNTHEPEVANYTVVKEWDDTDKPTKRPDSVTVTLYENGVPTDKTMVLSESNNWTGVWERLPVNSNGMPRSYTVAETGYTNADVTHTGVPTDYTATVAYDRIDHIATVTNTYNPETMTVNVQKSWEDNYNQDGMRPQSISVYLQYKLKAEDPWTVTDQVRVLSADNEWEASFANLPKRAYGEEITYGVVETPVEGYTVSYSDLSSANVITVINTHVPEKTTLGVSKIWADQENRDGIRPASITLTLYADGVAVPNKTATLNAQNEWDVTFDGLDKYAGGREIDYTVVEDVPQGYTASYNKSTDADGNKHVSIINSHVPEQVYISVAKVWNDDNDRDDLRPDSVDVSLLLGNEVVATKTLGVNNNWSEVFAAYKYKDGAEVDLASYTVKETTAVTGYTSAVTGNAETGFTITNTHELEKTTMRVTKVWNDGDNRDGVRPDSVTIHLLKNGDHMGEAYKATVTADADGNWTHTWNNLFANEEGKPINYTVYEEMDTTLVNAGYREKTERDSADHNHVIITNSRETDKTNFTVQKAWDDANDQDALRPASITVQLVADGTAVENSAVTLNLNNYWKHTWTGLDKNKAGSAIEYTVEEIGYTDKAGAYHTGVAEGYTSTANADLTGNMVLTNEHVPAEVSVEVTKVWEDNHNQDGKRPASITLQLMQRGESMGDVYKVTVTPDADGNWTHTWNNLPKNYGIGLPNVYTVVEEAAEGYTTTYSAPSVSADGSVHSLTVTNTHVPETTSLTVNKVWDDNNNQDGIRPKELTLTVYADDVKTDKTITVKASENWAGTIEGLPVYKDSGTRIVYTVREDTVPQGYTCSGDASAENGYKITNRHEPLKAEYTVQKVWDDNNDKNGMRPQAIQVTLYENGRPSTREDAVLALSASNDWAGSWMLPVNQNAAPISYTMVESAYSMNGTDFTAGVPKDYTVTHSYNTGNRAATVTNTYHPELIAINVQKTWADNDNQDGKRPAEVTVTLYADGVSTGKTATLNAQNEWDVTFSGLNKFAHGKEVKYTVKEAPVAYYEASYSDISAAGVITVTNTHEIEKTSLTVNKVWDDNNNQDGKRPASITLTLYADGVSTGKIATITPDAEGNWPAHTFTGLDKYTHGREIVYTVKENAVPGYTTTYSAVTGNTITITNTHAPEMAAFFVSKTWEDGDNRDGKRPEAVTVNLKRGGTTIGTIVLSAANNWKDVLRAPKYENGTVIADYSVVEAPVEYYEPAYTTTTNADGSKQVAIKNSHTPATTSVSVSKVWQDSENQDGVRPNSITVHLLADGEHMDKKFAGELSEGETYKVTLSAANNWTHTWTGLYANDEGDPVNYTVYEEEVGNDYIASYKRDAVDASHVIITNARDAAHVNFTVQKVWQDANNQDGLRPESITVQLVADGTVVENSAVTLTADMNWKYTWTGLDKNKNGVAIDYTVAELTELNGYDTTIGEDETLGVATITNKHTPNTVSLKVDKVWEDADDQDGKRPTSVTVKLYRNGREFRSALLDGKNNWAYTFTDLPEHYDIAKDNVYTVVEEVPAGYTASYSNNGTYIPVDTATNGSAGSITITNRHVPETTALTVKKLWNDANDQDGIRPDTLALAVYANGKNTGETITLKASENWIGTKEGLPKYNNGILVTYTVKEDVVPDGYTCNSDATAANGYTITNTHTPKTNDYRVVKVWNDAQNTGTRPNSVIITMYENGKATDNTVTLNAANNWQAVWEDLPEFRNGAPISYTVVENGYTYPNDANTYTGVPQDYSVTHAYNYETHVATVTNTYNPDVITVNVQKFWDDNQNQDGKRPAEVTVTLYADGVSTGKTATLDESNAWDASFTVNKYDGKEEIVYTVVEDAVEGYTTSYSNIASDGVIIVTNSHAPLKTSLSVSTEWNDAENQDGIRPDQITVTLYADGASTGKTATLEKQADGSWSAGVFTGLDQYIRGREITYTVVESTVDGYTADYIPGTNADGIKHVTVKNTHVPELVEFNISKVWEDDNDRDDLRPREVTVNLKQGETTVNSLQLNATNNWQGVFSAPKYQNGVEVAYSVEENAVNGYTATYDTTTVNGNKYVTIKNTHTPATTTVSVSKVWKDSANQDGKRPTEVTVHLLADGEHMDRKFADSLPAGETYKVTLSAENNWTHTWSGLYVNDEGDPVNYTVLEETVGEGYVASYERDADKTSHVIVTNTREIEKISFIVQKVWRDNNNQDKARPECIQLQLLANGEEVGRPVTLDASMNWKYTWTGLDKNKNGAEISYTVEELTQPGDYTTSIQKDEELGITTVTNTREPNTVTLSISKKWEDAEDQDGKRPASVSVTLYQNGYVYAGADNTVTLNARNNWTYTWTGLPEHHGIGRDNIYTVVEAPVTGYTVSYSGNGTYIPTGTNPNGSIVITNTHQPETTQFTVQKIWDDNKDQDGRRPKDLTLTILADGVPTDETITLTPGENWTGTVTGLPKYKNGGTEIVYTVVEPVVEGYESSITGSAEAGFTITNTHTPKIIDLKVEKVWEDANNNDNKRPEKVEITLLDNGVPVAGVSPLVLTASNNWIGVFKEMPRFRNGMYVNYSVVETGYWVAGDSTKKEGLPTGYTASYTYSERNPDADVSTATITNKYILETVGINVQKTWLDNDDQDGVRPASITVWLWYKLPNSTEWVKTEESMVLHKGNEWAADFTGLQKNYNRQPITYNVSEDAVDGYTATYTPNNDLSLVNITNTHTPETTQVHVKKVWDDNNDQDGKRPDSVTITLYANGVSTGKTAELDETNGYEATFEDLPKNSMGKAITYRVYETDLSEAYTVSYTGWKDATTGSIEIQLTNTHEPEKISIPVKKVWEDNRNQDGKRPTTITAALYANGTKLRDITLTADEFWVKTIPDLPKYEGGHEIVYTLKETSLPDGYTCAGDATSANNYTLTNTHDPEKIQFKAVKVWDDANDSDGKRPDKIVLHLLKNGAHMGEAFKAEVSAAADGTWTHTWELDKYEAGQQIHYSVQEEPVFLKAASSASTDPGGTTPAMRANDRYDATYAYDTANNIATVTNKYVPETVVITAHKVWIDGDNRDGLRPDEVTAVLSRKDGKPVKAIQEERTLNPANGWTVSWTVPKYENGGTLIEYTVTEPNTYTGYSNTVKQETQYDSHFFILTSEHEPATTGITVLKQWEDENDNDDKRPEGIIIQLYANSNALPEHRATLNEGNGWSASWQSSRLYPLYVFENGVEIQYTVAEVGYILDGVEYTGSPDWYQQSFGTDPNNKYTLTITNTHTTEKINVTIQKVWDDTSASNRPDSIGVTLLRNGNPYGDKLVLDANSNWKATVSAHKYTAGELAEYTVTEDPVTGYEAAYSTATDADGNITVTVTNTRKGGLPTINPPGGGEEPGGSVPGGDETVTHAYTVNKVWLDASDAEGLRPNHVTVQLYRNGEPYGKRIRLDAGNNWQYTVDLPMVENGEWIEWTVREVAVPRFYKVSYDQASLTVYNTLQSKNIPQTGDYTNILPWVLLFAGCLLGSVLIVASFGKKRKKN